MSAPYRTCTLSQVLNDGSSRGAVRRQWLVDERSLQYRSGDPLTIWSGNSNVDGSGEAADRAVQTGPAYGGSVCGASVNCKSFLNPASFTNPTAGSGIASFEVLRRDRFGPGFAEWDASLARRFSISERTYLQFRAEYFNLLPRQPRRSRHHVGRLIWQNHRFDSTEHGCGRKPGAHRPAFVEACLLTGRRRAEFLRAKFMRVSAQDRRRLGRAALRRCLAFTSLGPFGMD